MAHRVLPEARAALRRTVPVEAVEDIAGVRPPSEHAERARFYGWHQDGPEGEVAVRKLSMVVQLSDPAAYAGGELELFNVVEDRPHDEAERWRDAARQQGSVIAFPAFEVHRVRAMGGGRRYSLVCWIGGPPFR